MEVSSFLGCHHAVFGKMPAKSVDQHRPLSDRNPAVTAALR
jgi:hypothetical protein